MGSVMIKCPNTGIAIPTGIEADRSSFSRTPVFIAQCYCLLCRTDHEWFAMDAWVEDARTHVPRPGERQVEARGAPRCEAA
jgi:hypothetical protein